jgi:hypothetical protein
MMLRSNFFNNLFKPYEAGNFQGPVSETKKSAFSSFYYTLAFLLNQLRSGADRAKERRTKDRGTTAFGWDVGFNEKGDALK